jgi:excisionase family DNA binding protein
MPGVARPVVVPEPTQPAPIDGADSLGVMDKLLPPGVLLFSVPEVLGLPGLRVGRDSFYAMLARGEGPRVVRIGRKVRIPRATLLSWLGGTQSTAGRPGG